MGQQRVYCMLPTQQVLGETKAAAIIVQASTTLILARPKTNSTMK
jgi:hypothetical protein